MKILRAALRGAATVRSARAAPSSGDIAPLKVRSSWTRAASLWFTAVTAAGCVSTGYGVSPEQYAAIHNVAVVSLVGDTIEFQSQSLPVGLIGGGAAVQEVKVDWGLEKMAADDVAHALSAHFNVLATEAPEGQTAAAPNPPAPTLESLRKLGIEPSDKVDTYVIVHPTTLKGSIQALLGRDSYAFTGLVVTRGRDTALLASYAVTVIDARTGKSLAEGKPEIHKRALGKMGALVLCDAALWPETPAAMTDAQRQGLMRAFTTLLKASLPWALANAGLLSEAEATKGETAAGKFTACHRAAF